MNGKWSINQRLDKLVLQALEQGQGDRHQAAKHLTGWIEETSFQRVDPRDRRLLEEALLAWTPGAQLADQSAPDEGVSTGPYPQLS